MELSHRAIGCGTRSRSLSDSTLPMSALLLIILIFIYVCNQINKGPQLYRRTRSAVVTLIRYYFKWISSQVIFSMIEPEFNIVDKKLLQKMCHPKIKYFASNTKLISTTNQRDRKSVKRDLWGVLPHLWFISANILGPMEYTATMLNVNTWDTNRSPQRSLKVCYYSTFRHWGHEIFDSFEDDSIILFASIWHQNEA